jgi:hypothetical protein
VASAVSDDSTACGAYRLMQLIITSARVATIPGMYCKVVKTSKQVHAEVSIAGIL